MGGELIITINNQEDWKSILHRCFRCGYCKFTYDYSDLNCPSYKKYRFETYSTGGRMWLIYGVISGELPWSQGVANVIYACTTCGNCTENCRFAKFKDFLVDFIEAARIEATERGFCPENHQNLLHRIENPEFNNPYGELNSTNEELKEEYNLPDNAEWVYFIGCTSNYRQKNLRDATLRFLKKTGIDFTLVDEHCCCSPIMRTGQLSHVNENINFNLAEISNTGATKVITSCAGCYRTLKKDWVKYSDNLGFEVYHTTDLIKKLLDEGKISFTSSYEKTLTYHDPCHLGRHMGFYEIPREIINQIPGVEFKEMVRNRENAWCCGAGGGVKIGFPEWSLDISKERLEEAQKTQASIIASICPFCKTGLSDANKEYEMGFEILDLIEILDMLEYEVSNIEQQ